MQISPRYDGPPLLRLDAALGDPAIPLLRQRRRLGTLLTSLDDAQWAAPSRCDRWSVQDVISHLVSTNQFWAVSLGQGFAGQPTRYLLGFDPVATPAQLVDGQRGRAPGDVLEAYQESVEALADLVTGVGDEAWALPAEAPPGHIAASAVVLHALWDSWVHERDIALPLGLPQPEEPDEVLASLRYAAALGPAFLASTGDGRSGAFAVEVEDPHLRIVVEVGPTVVVHEGDGPDVLMTVRGRAVDVLEALSFRVPHDPPIPEEHAWMLAELAEVFDQA